METLEASKARLIEAISGRVNSRAPGDILLVLNCIKITQHQALEAFAEDFGDAVTCSRNLLRLIDAKVDRQSFFTTWESAPGFELLRDEFERWERVFYMQLAQLIESVRLNTNTVTEHYADLRRAKRQSRNDQEWNQALASFAADQFFGVDLQQLIRKLSPQIDIFVSERYLNDLPGRFAWQTFAIEENKRKSEDQDSDEFEGDGYEYEQHIADIISKSVPDARVQVTKSSGDQGADIIFEIDRFKVVIQTKLYSGSVGNDAVQQVYAAKRFYGATAAIVVTNSTYTQSAIELAEALQVALLHEDDVGPMFSQAYA